MTHELSLLLINGSKDFLIIWLFNLLCLSLPGEWLFLKHVMCANSDFCFFQAKIFRNVFNTHTSTRITCFCIHFFLQIKQLCCYMSYVILDDTLLKTKEISLMCCLLLYLQMRMTFCLLLKRKVHF